MGIRGERVHKNGMKEKGRRKGGDSIGGGGGKGGKWEGEGIYNMERGESFSSGEKGMGAEIKGEEKRARGGGEVGHILGGLALPERRFN